eukprot:scaffold20832_cov39-Phaeocystis_antarctica.AAC.2
MRAVLATTSTLDFLRAATSFMSRSWLGLGLGSGLGLGLGLGSGLGLDSCRAPSRRAVRACLVRGWGQGWGLAQLGLAEVESHVNVATEQRAAEGGGVEELATLLDVRRLGLGLGSEARGEGWAILDVVTLEHLGQGSGLGPGSGLGSGLGLGLGLGLGPGLGLGSGYSRAPS